MSTDTNTATAIVSEARLWLGTPWQHQQRQRGLAVDCAGLIIGVGKALGLVDAGFDIADYSRMPDGTLLAICADHLDRVPRAELAPGHVLVMAMEDEPQHLGIVGDYRHGGLSLIHASSRAGRVIETRLMFAANNKFRAAYAYRGVA